jgi:TRAP-type mannitol/chloroaromatic compound transport system substrate-binding protein
MILRGRTEKANSMAKRMAAPARLARRRFLLAGAAGTAAVAMPQVSRAQTVSWRMQSAWSARDVLHEVAVDYARRVAAMTANRLKIDVVAAGAVVPTLQMADAVHAGILHGGHGVATLWSNKHKAFALFGAPPSFGWDSQGFLAWFYNGGGEALYRELINDILKVNLTGLLYCPMPPQPLGWFKKEIKSADDLKGLRFRSAGLAGEMFAALGVRVVSLPNSEIVPVMERDLLDATEANNPATDLQLGIPDVAKFYMLGSHHRQAEALEVIFNKARFEALPGEIKVILRHAALSASSEHFWSGQARYSKDFEEIRKRKIRIAKTGPELLQAQLKIWDKLIADHSKDSFFAKVIVSQKAWVKRTQPYLEANDLGSAEHAAAYRHFFG